MKDLMLFLLLFVLVTAQGQTDKELLAQLDEEEKEAVEALVMYPEDTRLAILECSRYPEALIKIGRLQANTSAANRKGQRAPQEYLEKTGTADTAAHYAQNAAPYPAGSEDTAPEEAFGRYAEEWRRIELSRDGRGSCTGAEKSERLDIMAP